jgi:hypothetical protein
MEFPWTNSSQDILAHYSVDPQGGLSDTQAVKHAQLYGKNGECPLFSRFQLFAHGILQNYRKNLQRPCGS